MHKKQANCFSVYVNRDQRRGKECCCVFFSTSCCENSIEVHIPTTAPRKRAAQHGNYQKGLMTMVLDVLTPLSDCRHETVEKVMERRISRVSYVLDGFPRHVFVLRVFMCLTNITLFCLYFVSLFPATTPWATTSLPYHHGLSRLCIHPGYLTRAITLHHTRTSGYHTCYQ